MFDLEFETELYSILDKYASEWKDDPLDGDEVEKLVNHLRNQLNLINGNITNDEYLSLESEGK